MVCIRLDKIRKHVTHKGLIKNDITYAIIIGERDQVLLLINQSLSPFRPPKLHEKKTEE